jgi:hypothetical protein
LKTSDNDIVPPPSIVLLTILFIFQAKNVEFKKLYVSSKNVNTYHCLGICYIRNRKGGVSMDGFFGGNNSSIWIILLLCCFCGNGFGGVDPAVNRCEGNGFGGGFAGILPIILILCCCGGNGFGLGGFGPKCC